MKTHLVRFTLYATLVYLTGFTLNSAGAASQPSGGDNIHFCGFTEQQPDNRRYARSFAPNLNVGEPRTVRMIYFLPNNRPFRADVVQRLKNDIRKIQTFYAQQMEANGYGFKTFKVETDLKGEPMIHRVAGQHPESYYLDDTSNAVVEEIGTAFNLDANIYLIIVDNSSGSVGRSAKRFGGLGRRTGKDSGFALVPEPSNNPRVHVMAHELGHAFGLYHDFTNRAYLMSYGAQSRSRLSACHADFLAVHSYFNPDSPIEDAPPSTIELISPLTYPAGSESVSVHLKLTDSDGLHQVFLLHYGEAWGCRGLAGEKHAVAEIDYDGYSGVNADWNDVSGLSDSDIHHITAMAVDMDGNVSSENFTLSATEPTHPRPQTLEIISGDNQQEQTNIQLPQPLVVEVRDHNGNPFPGAQVTFSVIAGTGRLSGRFTLENATSDANGRAEKPFTPGPGTNIVQATIQLQPGIPSKPVVIFRTIGYIDTSAVPVMAGDYQRWHLPEDATRRLGKGRIGASDRSVAFSPDGEHLAVASGIGVWIYEVATAREVALLPSANRVHSVAFSIDGKMLAAGVHYAGVHLWDVTTHKQIATLPARDYIFITSVSFSPDQRTIAFRTIEGTVKMWDVATGSVTTLEERHGPESGGVALTPDDYSIFNPLSVSFSPDGRLLASGSHDGTVKLWDVATQTLIAALHGHRLGISSVSFSPDGRLLASGSIDETVKMWDVLARENIATLRGHRRQVSSVSFSRDGRLLASGASGVVGGPDSESASDATIKLWDVATKQNIDTFGPHPRGVYAVSFSPNGKLLASGSADGTVKLWEVATGNVEFEISGHASMGKSVAFSPVEMSLASGSRDGTVKLWDVATGRDAETFGPHALGVNAVSFSPDGTLLASGSHDSTVKLWDVETGTSIASRFTYACGGQVYSVSFSPDGAIVASADALGVLLWNSATGDQISTPAGFASSVRSVSFSPVEPILAFGSDFGAKLWDVATHTPIATLGNASKVNSVTFSPVEPILATAGKDSDQVTLWNLLTRKQIGTLAGQNVFIESISFSPDGTVLAGGTRDNTVRVWDVATHTPLATLEGHTGRGTSGVTSVSFSHDGTLLASGSDQDGTVLLWDLTALTLSLPLSGDETIPDFNLRGAIRNALGKSAGDPIVLADVATLTNLEAHGAGIIDLAGLELATNLLELSLSANSVSDISALSGLTKLKTLYLNSNSVSDISALSGLTNLGYLSLDNNSISDISALSGLTKLTGLDIARNPISDISALSGLTKLETLRLNSNSVSDISALSGLTNLGNLRLDDNSISDISALSGLTKLETLRLNSNSVSDISILSTLTNLTELHLDGNSISDLSPLVGNSGLGSGDQIDVRVNPLNYASIHAHIPTLQSRGVEVEFDNRAHPALLKISGDTQIGAPGAALAQPFVVEAQDENGLVLAGISVTFTVTSGDGTLSVQSTTTNTNGRAQSTLTLGPNLGTHTVLVSAVGIEAPVTFNAEASRIPKKLEIISGVDQEGLPGDVLEKPFVVEVRGQFDKPLPGAKVTFSVTSGGGTLSATSATTDSNGWAESTLTLGPNAGTNTVTVSVAGSQETRTFNAEGTRIPKTLQIISGVDQAGLPGDALEKAFVVEVRDADGSGLEGVPVTFTITAGGGSLSKQTTTTDSNGRAESILTLGPNPGTNTVEATVTGIEEKRTFTAEGSRIPKELEIISGVDQAGLPGDALEKAFVVEVRDEFDKPLPGAQVTFTVTSGDGTLSETSATTDSNGRAESTLTLGPNPGTNTVTVSVTGSQETRTFNAEGSRIPKKLEIISGVDQAGLPGDALEKPFVVEVRDQSDKPFPGVEVTFTVTAGGGKVQPEIATTDENGRAESTLTLGPNPGTNTVEATVTGIEEKRTFTAEGIRIPKALEIISGIDQAGLPGDALENPFVVEVRDQTDKPLPGVEVTFTVTAGGGKVQPEIATTDENGRAESILTLGPNPGTNTVTVSVTGSQETRTFTAEGIRIPKTLQTISGKDQEGLPGDVLEKPFVVEVRDQTDKPLPGVEVTFTVTSGGGTLSATHATTDENGRAESTLTLGSTPGTNTVRVSVEGNTQAVATLTIETVRMFALSIPAGTHLIHIPLAVNQINGEDGTIETVGDVYDALGESIRFIITLGADGGWKTYLGDLSAGSAADAAIGDDTGLLVVMSDAKTLELVGDALGTDGASMINIDVGNNLVGLPLKPSAGLSMISDLLGDGVGAIAVSKADGMGFHTIREPGQGGDAPIVGGVGYLVVYIGTEATSIPIVGSAWENSGAVSAAPAVAFDGSQTPVLYVEGGVMDEFNMLSRIPELRITVKNLSTGASLDTVLGTELSTTAYSATFVELSRHAAKAGDVIEIVAHSPNPYVGVRPVPQIVVSAEQVLTSRISLPDLELYEIPSETVLLANYPNPFNPETWIPYRLAKAAEVTLDIYDTNGRLVRTIDVGFKPAAVYESRASAIYWDGRNNQGESVASGVYFYHLSAGTYSATRKMLIMK